MKSKRQLIPEALLRLLGGFLVMVLLHVSAAMQPALAQLSTNFNATGGVNRWPQGRVPYVFAANVTESVKKAARAAMNEWMDSGGAISFIETPGLTPASQIPYLLISIGSRNTSVIGPQVPTELNLVAGMVEGAHSHATHELGHALGYPHEQSRPDRDAYVTVHFDRIIDGEKHNFVVDPWEEWPPGVLFTPYSYDSIMHYDWCLGSLKGCGQSVKGKDDTMTTADPFWQYRTGGWIGTDSAGLADSDRRRAEMVFGKAIWVDKNSSCTFADGRRNCDVFNFIGPFKTVTDAVGAVPDLWIPTAQPLPTLMIKTGTYSKGSSGPLRLSKPMKLVAWERRVRIE